MNEQEKALVRLFYSQREFLPAWDFPARLASLVLELEQLGDDGLNPANYQLNAIRQLNSASLAESAVCVELLASLGYLQARHDLHYGRLQQAQLEPLWQLKPAAPDDPIHELLQAQQGLTDLPASFASARPALPQYQQLRRAYQQLLQQSLPDWPQLPAGPLLRPGMQDERVPLLVQRLTSEGYLPAVASTVVPPAAVASEALNYSPERVAAVMAFQQNHALQADGLLGAGTLTELNISPLARRDQLKINLERWRWLAQEFEANLLVVDIAAAQLTLYQAQQAVWHTRTQVGRPARPTPLLKSSLNRLTLNPTWTVPPTIYRKDKLPAIRQSPDFFITHKMRVIDQAGNELDPSTLDWNRPGSIMLRQDAGPDNPLGNIALRFPNPFSVYLHDTPSRDLFAKAPRAFSSGCVRVEQVLQILPFLLNPAEQKRVDELLSLGKTYEYRLPQPMPILLAYWTAEANESGQPLYRPDVYGHDAKLLAALQTATR